MSKLTRPLSRAALARAGVRVPEGSRVVTEATPMKVRKPRKAKREPVKPWCTVNDQWGGSTILGLPEPPSANRYWRCYRNRVVKSAEARAYQEVVALIAAKAVPFDGEVSVVLTWWRGRASGDLDNRLKVTLDALKGLAYQDDRQVVEIHAFRHDQSRGDGYVVVEIRPVAPP